MAAVLEARTWIEQYRGCSAGAVHSMDILKEVTGSLVAVCGDSPVLLQACEDVLDQKPSLVEVAVILARLFFVRPLRCNNFLILA